MIHVRSASAKHEDMPNFIRLLEELGYAQDLEAFKIRLEKFLQIPGYGMGIAYEDENIVGMVAWSQSMTLVTDKTRIRIEGLIVGSKYRKQGVGRALMNFVEDFAKQFSPCIIELTSGARRSADGSHDFYKSIGYSNSGATEKVYFRKELL